MDWNQVLVICLSNFIVFILFYKVLWPEFYRLHKNLEEALSKVESINKKMDESMEKIEKLLKQIHGN